MKTVTLTDEEVQELREILNSKISKYLDDFWKFLKTIKLFKNILKNTWFLLKHQL